MSKRVAKPHARSATGDDPDRWSLRAEGRFGRWLKEHQLALYESAQRLLAKPTSSLLTIAVLAIALALPGAFLSGIGHLQDATERFERPGSLAVFMKADLSVAQVQEISAQLALDARIERIDLRTPDESLADLREGTQLGSAADLLDENPLPAVLFVQARPEHREPDAMTLLADHVATREDVEMVVFDRRWVERFAALLAIAERLAQVVGGLLGLAVLLVVGNTIRLEIQERVTEIETAKLMGATDAYVRRPFLYSGLWLGLLGGALACGLVAVAILLLNPAVSDLARSYGSRFELPPMDLRLLFDLLLLGALVGWLGAGLAAGRHIRRVRPE